MRPMSKSVLRLGGSPDGCSIYDGRSGEVFKVVICVVCVPHPPIRVCRLAGVRLDLHYPIHGIVVD